MKKPALRKTILVVEDDETMRELIGLHLLGAGYAVRTVSDGAAAAKACKVRVPDLIISDVHMPRLDGFALMTLLKSDERLKSVPVIFLTVDGQSVNRSKELGAAAFLTKPVLAQKLLEAVAQELP